MKWWMILIIVAAAIVVVLLILYRQGKKMEARQAEQQEQIDAAKQTVSMLVIDKKILKLKDAGFPQYVVEQTPKRFRNRKVPVVKGKVGPRISVFIADKSVFEVIPVKKEIKATISGLYITDIRVAHGSLNMTKTKKKEGFMTRLLKKGRGEDL